MLRMTAKYSQIARYDTFFTENDEDYSHETGYANEIDKVDHGIFSTKLGSSITVLVVDILVSAPRLRRVVSYALSKMNVRWSSVHPLCDHVYNQFYGN